MTAAAIRPFPTADLTPVPVMETITPERAIALLEQNTCNRSVREDKVKRFADDMKHGRWQVSQDGIGISSEGILLNGQHRLYAIVEANVSIEALVIYNMSEDSMAIMDTGTARTAADFLGSGGMGEKNPGNLAAVLRLITAHNDGDAIVSKAERIISNSRLYETLAAHPEARHSVDIASRYSKKVGLPPRVVGFTHWLIAQTNGAEVADLFFETLESRAGEQKGSPVLALDKRLREIARARQRANVQVLSNLVVRAWNAWAAGRTLTTIPLQPNGVVPPVDKWSRK